MAIASTPPGSPTLERSSSFLPPIQPYSDPYSDSPTSTVAFSRLDEDDRLGGGNKATQFQVRPRQGQHGPQDGTHPLRLHHLGQLKNIPIPNANHRAQLMAKRQEFHGLLNTLVGEPVTAYRYQFSKKRVIYYINGVEHILKIQASNRDHANILRCIGELEDIVFQIRGEHILDTSYNSESVTLTGKVSPYYKVITPVLTKLARSTFEGGIGLALRHYRDAYRIPEGPQGHRIRHARRRFNTFKTRVEAEITRLQPSNDVVDKKKLVALKALKDRFDQLNGRDGYQLVLALIIGDGGQTRGAMIDNIEIMRGRIQGQWAVAEAEDSRGADHIEREEARRKRASVHFSADIAGLVFARAFSDNVEEARFANEQYRNKHCLYGEQRVELEFLMNYLANDRPADSLGHIAANLKGLTPVEARALAGSLLRHTN